MEITPRELRDVEIRESFRGYNRDDVNELLERAAATLDAANERMQQMNERLTTVQSETGHTRETEDILHRTLLLAQRAADEAVGEATAKARQMLDDAEIQSRRLVADAEADARRRGETERRRLEEEVLDLAGRRDALLADVEALTRFEADYRDRMVRALEADLSALRSRPPASPGPRPETSDVELPVLSEGFTRREPEPPPRPTRRRRARPIAVRGASVGAGTGAVRSDTGPDRDARPRRPSPRSRPRRPARRASPSRTTAEGVDASGRRAVAVRPRGHGRARRSRSSSRSPRRSLPTADPFAPKPARRHAAVAASPRHAPPRARPRSRQRTPTRSTPRCSTTTRSSRRCARRCTTRRRSVPATRRTTPARTCSSTRRPRAPASATSSAAAADPRPRYQARVQLDRGSSRPRSRSAVAVVGGRARRTGSSVGGEHLGHDPVAVAFDDLREVAGRRGSARRSGR